MSQRPILFGEEIFRNLVDSMPYIVFISNIGGETMFLNQKWYDYTGNSPGDISYDSWSKAVHPEDLEKIFKGWQDAYKKGTPWSQTYRLRHHSGIYKTHLGHSVAEYDKDGIIRYWMGSAIEIDRIKNDEFNT